MEIKTLEPSNPGIPELYFQISLHAPCMGEPQIMKILVGAGFKPAPTEPLLKLRMNKIYFRTKKEVSFK
jgi:hypothetical protein